MDSLDVTPEVENDNDNVLEVEFFGEKNKGKRKRSLTSEVWTYFEKVPGKKFADNKERAKCNMCGTTYVTESRNGGNAGTGNMKNHLEICVKRDTRDVGQMLLSQNLGSLTCRAKFDAKRFRELLSVAIIKHDLPFQFVEYESILAIFKYLYENIQVITRNTARADVLKLHEKEKIRIRNMLVNAPGRICLTSDLWTSINTDGYICLTAHFIDKCWNLQRRILNYCFMPPPHNGISLVEKINLLLREWGIENKIFSITLDNSSCNDVCVGMLKSQFALKQALVCNGEFFHIRCCAHILNLIVQDGLKEIDGAVEKIRETVKYVRGSQVRKQKFLESAKQMSIDCKKGLRQDVPTRWNSTYLMLDSALHYRQAFSHLDLMDTNYKHCPSALEWAKVEKISKFLKGFYEISCIFSGTKYPTSNLYFSKVFMTHLTLKQCLQSGDEYMTSIANLMHSKFLKYWKDLSVILAISAILDPRYKMQFVDFAYQKVYGTSSLEFKNVRSKLFSLFNEYMCKSTSSTSTNKNGGASYDMESNKAGEDIMEEFDEFESIDITACTQKTQLELYLDEPRADRTMPLDILSFWKGNEFRYPDLASMARDILSIPISTVASESAFSIRGRVIDQYRSALKPNAVEALVCTRDWLFEKDGNEMLNLDELTEDVMNINITDGTTSALSSTPNPSLL